MHAMNGWIELSPRDEVESSLGCGVEVFVLDVHAAALRRIFVQARDAYRRAIAETPGNPC